MQADNPPWQAPMDKSTEQPRPAINLERKRREILRDLDERLRYALELTRDPDPNYPIEEGWTEEC